MSGHTPGPWLLDEPGIGNDHVNGGGYHSITAGKGYHGGGPLGFEIQAFMDEADALLVTAAPDLLEALEAMIFAAGAVAVPHEGERKCLQMGVDMALKAIARAKGEHP